MQKNIIVIFFIFFTFLDSFAMEQIYSVQAPEISYIEQLPDELILAIIARNIEKSTDLVKEVANIKKLKLTNKRFAKIINAHKDNIGKMFIARYGMNKWNAFKRLTAQINKLQLKAVDDPNGNSLLHLVVNSIDIAQLPTAVSYLLSIGQTPNLYNTNKLTPLDLLMQRAKAIIQDKLLLKQNTSEQKLAKIQESLKAISKTERIFLIHGAHKTITTNILAKYLKPIFPDLA